MLLQWYLGHLRFQQHILNNWKAQHKTVRIHIDSFSEKKYSLIGERVHVY